MLTMLPFWLACANGVGNEPATDLDPQFGPWWHDGKAELSGYSLEVDRYGSTVQGSAVLIYVTEPFSRSKHVKVDDPSAQPADVVDVLKLNLVRHFQTGIYDYSTMGSTFSALPSLSLLKSAFSSQEWCGHVYEQLDVKNGSLHHGLASYFEGESTEGRVKVPAGGILEEELFVRLRGFDGPFLPVGEGKTVPFLESAFYRRLAHRGLAWGEATLTRLPDAPFQTASTAIPCANYEVRTSGGRTGTFAIELAWPHRVVAWSWTTQAASFAGGTDQGTLLATERLPYWELHNPGDEALLGKLGLVVPAPVPPPSAPPQPAADAPLPPG